MTGEIQEGVAENKTGKNKVLLIVLSAVIIVAILSVVTYLAFGALNKKETPKQTSPQQTTTNTKSTEVNSIQSEQDLKAAGDNLSKNSQDTTQSDEAKLKSLVSE